MFTLRRQADSPRIFAPLGTSGLHHSACITMDSLFTQMYEADIKGGRTVGLAVIPDSIRDSCLMDKQAGRSGMDCGC